MVKTIHLLKSQVGMPHDLAWGLVMVTQLLILQELLAGRAWGLFVVKMSCVETTDALTRSRRSDHV